MEYVTLTTVFVAIIAYLLGSINTSIIVSKKKGIDIRKEGSKNPGTTNALRVMGKKAAIIVLLGDILKGVVSIGFAMIIAKIAKSDEFEAILLKEIAGVFVILGHNYPIFFGFKGGKGIATSIGVLLLVNFKIGLICLIFGIVIIAITRMVSLGSLLSAILFPVLSLVLDINYFVFSLIVCFLAIIKHRSNIKRIFRGEENKISFKK